MASLDSTIQLISKGLRDDEFFIKVAEILDKAKADYDTDFADVKYKLQDPTKLREEAIKEIIDELGFSYIRKLMDTLTNIEFNVLIDFISLLNLLKGSRDGLEIVMKLLGFDTIITEWWESLPNKEPLTFDLTVLMNTSLVPDFDSTLERVKIFTQHYVLPKLDLIDFKFVLESFLEKQTNVAGFVRMKHFGRIVERA
jgi:hypothetical protein